VGGGIGGLATALALRRVGIGSEVFEMAPEVREVVDFMPLPAKPPLGI